MRCMGWDTVFLYFIINRIEHTAINREKKFTILLWILFFSSFYRLLKNVTHWPDAFTPCCFPGSWIKSIPLFHRKRIPPGVWELNTSHLIMLFYNMSFKMMSFHNMSFNNVISYHVFQKMSCHFIACLLK